MPQQVCRFRVSLPVIPIGTDNVSQDFVFEATGSNVDLNLPQIYGLIEGFYNALGTGQVSKIGQYLSTDIDRSTNACTISAYDITAHLDGSPHGSPIDTTQFTLVAATDTRSMPPQCAVACGYRADYGSAIEHGPTASIPTDDDAIDQGAPSTHLGVTRPRAYLRGRFYLGPLNLNASASLFGTLGVNSAAVAAGFRSDIEVALNGLLQTSDGGLATQANMVVWSRRTASVNTARWYYVNENIATSRRRTDTTVSRVHAWVPIT